MGLNVERKRGEGGLELLLVDQIARLLDLRIGGQSQFFLNTPVGFLFEARMLNSQGRQGTEGKASYVSPMSYAARAPKKRAVEDFHQKPERQQRIRRGLKAIGAEKAEQPQHLNLHLRVAHKEGAHEGSDCSRGTQG